jgi:hypothetical protein
MHKFDGHSAEEVLASRGPVSEGGGTQRQDGPQSLATRVDQVRCHLIKVGISEENGLGQERFQSSDVFFNEGQAKSLVRVHATTLDEPYVR